MNIKDLFMAVLVITSILNFGTYSYIVWMCALVYCFARFYKK